MKRSPTPIVLWLLGSAILGFGGCEAKDPTSLPTSGAPATPATAPATSADPLGPRYTASLAEGIVFSRAGYPALVAQVYGMSKLEPWGRWTDGDVVVFRFGQSLPKSFTVELTGGAYGGNLGKPVKLRVGPVEREVVFNGGPFENQSTQSAEFTNEIGSDSLTVLLPSAAVPAGADGRRLGLALTALRVVEK